MRYFQAEIEHEYQMMEDGPISDLFQTFLCLLLSPMGTQRLPYPRPLHLRCSIWGAHQLTPLSGHFPACVPHIPTLGASITRVPLTVPRPPGLYQKPTRNS